MDVLGYAGKRVIVTGAASGMGAATAGILVDLGAEVHTIDVEKPAVTGLASYTECDLRDPGQIDRAVERIGRVVNMLFNCAGVPNSRDALDVLLVNFCGLRHLTERVVADMLDDAGSAVASIASLAGMGWRDKLPVVGALLATPDFTSARQWCVDHPEALAYAYGFSKEAINAYTAQRSYALAARGIRINCINPGPTDTPMMAEFEQANGKQFMDDFPVPLGRHATAEEQAWPLVLLNSARTAHVTGVALDVDGGFTAGLLTGQVAFGTRR